MLKKRILKACCLIGAVSLLAVSFPFKGNSIKAEAAAMRPASEIVKDMGVGWNLGNSLDSKVTWIPQDSSPSEFETGWGNPVTTKAMIDKITEAGFKTIRIPVTWGEHMDSSNKVNEAWMNRVKEVVDYAISDGVYVIINVHHDGNWCIPNYENEKEVTPKLEKLWEQIAEKFKDYDDHLIFETLNEPRVEGSENQWNGGTSEERDVVNKYNEAALNSIRSTGGNNSDRAVMIPTQAASGLQNAIEDFKVPDDKNVIASIHSYSPYFFAMDTSQYSVSTWGSDADKAALDSELDYYAEAFKSKGIPVVMGEFGSINKDNNSSRTTHAEYYAESCQKRGIPCIWWDNNYAEAGTGDSFGIFDRSSLTWSNSQIKDALIQGYKNAHSDSGSHDTPADDKSISLSSRVNNWGWDAGYQLYIDLKNNTSKDIDSWVLKIKKDNISFTNYWDVDIQEENGYYVITPKPWRNKIPANSSITISIQGSKSFDNKFTYEVYGK